MVYMLINLIFSNYISGTPSQKYDFSPLCFRRCTIKMLFKENDLSYTSQVYGFSSVYNRWCSSWQKFDSTPADAYRRKTVSLWWPFAALTEQVIRQVTDIIKRLFAHVAGIPLIVHIRVSARSEIVIWMILIPK